MREVVSAEICEKRQVRIVGNAFEEIGLLVFSAFRNLLFLLKERMLLKRMLH